MNIEQYRNKLIKLEKITNYLMPIYLIAAVIAGALTFKEYKSNIIIFICIAASLMFITFCLAQFLRFRYDDNLIEMSSKVKAEVISLQITENGYAVEYKLGTKVSIYNTNNAEITTETSHVLVKEIRDVNPYVNGVHCFELYLNLEDKNIAKQFEV